MEHRHILKMFSLCTAELNSLDRKLNKCKTHDFIQKALYHDEIETVQGILDSIHAMYKKLDVRDIEVKLVDGFELETNKPNKKQ